MIVFHTKKKKNNNNINKNQNQLDTNYFSALLHLQDSLKKQIYFIQETIQVIEKYINIKITNNKLQSQAYH